MCTKKIIDPNTYPQGIPQVKFHIIELKSLTDANCFRLENIIQTIYLIFLSFHNVLVFLKIYRNQQYQRPFRDQQMYHKQNYLHLQLLLLTLLDGEMHRKLNSVVENQVTGNIFMYLVASRKKSITLSYISCSKILSKLDNRDVCLQSEHFKFHSFLEMVLLQQY